MSSAKSPKKYWIKNKFIREWSEALLFAFVVAFVCRTWLYAPFRVPTGSMIPTIDVGDHIFADMSAYGYQIPFTSNKISAKPIERGDVVIFPSPLNPAVCDSELYSAWDSFKSLFIGVVNSNYVPICVDFIKRVVALEGDEIEFRGENFYVNQELEKNYTPFFNPMFPQINLYHREIVPQGHVFTMGDNRRDSLDGRFWRVDGKPLSFVDTTKVRAKAKWIYLSIDPNSGLLEGGLRYDRMFTSIR